MASLINFLRNKLVLMILDTTIRYSISTSGSIFHTIDKYCVQHGCDLFLDDYSIRI
jgi:hypothetical protein